MTNQECAGHSQECILRHEAQSESKEQIKEMYKIICGGTEPESSMKTKLDILFNERHERRAFNQKVIFAFSIAVISFIFWCGKESTMIQNHSERLDKIEQSINKLEIQR